MVDFDALEEARKEGRANQPPNNLSYEVGYVKPDIRIFQAALDAIDCSAHETLMVGDRVDNDLEPARAHDWQTFAIGSDSAPCFSRLRGLLLKENCVRGGLDTDQPCSS